MLACKPLLSVLCKCKLDTQIQAVRCQDDQAGDVTIITNFSNYLIENVRNQSKSQLILTFSIF